MNWHRLFGLLLTDFFAGSPFIVELEKDLSIKKQLLDVVILRKRHGRFLGRLPDGFDDLANHNLITFKSHHEALDDWALKELTGHYVNYRKQVSPARGALLPEAEFRLYAVCSRYPHNLAAAVPWSVVQDGVYEYCRGTDVVRIIVAHELPRTENNALLHLLSAAPDQVRYGVEHYAQRSTDTSTVLGQLFEGYQREGLKMSYTMEDFRRDYVKEHLKDLTLEERLEGLSANQIEKYFQRGRQERPTIEGFRRDYVKEHLKDLSPEERLEGLSPEQIERYLRGRQQRPTSKRKKKK